MVIVMRRCGGTPPYRLGQQIRQFYAGIVQTRLDGSNRDVQGGGNLIDGLVGEIAQHDHLPERRRILTGHLRTRAAENVMQLLSVNSLSRCPAVPTAWFDQNGRIRKQINKEGLLLCDVTVPEEDFGMRGRRVNAEKFIAQRNKKP